MGEWTGLVGCATDTPRPLGTITRHEWTTDEAGDFEHRERVGATVECPECGKTVELLQDTDCWTETTEGSRRWKHSGYGPVMGECCDTLLADDLRSIKAFRPPVRRSPDPTTPTEPNA